MEDLFFGDGWLSDLLRETGVPIRVKDKVREKMQALAAGGEGEWEEDWRIVDGLLDEGQVGEALEKAMGSLYRTFEILGDHLGEESNALERPFSTFMVRNREIKKILHPREDMQELTSSDDDLDVVISLEMINDARRLLASWGAGVWGEGPLQLIPRLEEDLEELRKSQAAFAEDESLDDEDIEREIEQADRFATMATRFARDLMDLHMLNAKNPEVRMRFLKLWETVRQLAEDRDMRAAAFEAMQVLEEALGLAGLGGGELLQKIDLLYDVFDEVEELRKAVDHLVSVSRDGEGSVQPEQGRFYIESIAEALGDMGLEVG
ncbi:MAG: hypothetical protein C4536_08435 [Actinobacteria bacterium]|jgi:hypothetical protein|nr:MAG: hypothetical protein C4536_08435 [Actinomycetota bacterium]